MRLYACNHLPSLFGCALLAAGMVTSSGSLAQWKDDPWEIFTLHCESMQGRVEHEVGTDQELLLSYHSLKLNYDTVEQYKAKVPDAQRSRPEYRDCTAKLPEVKKLLAKAERLQKERDAVQQAEAQQAHDDDPNFKKAKSLGFDDYAGLVGIYSSINNGYVDRARLARYLLVAEDQCNRRFYASGVVGNFYILSVDDTNYCGFGLVQVAVRRSAAVSYEEGEWIKHKYFRIVGTEEFQKSNGFPVTLLVLDPVGE